MKNYRFLAFILVAMFVLGLTACELSASTPPPPPDEGIDAEGTQSAMAVLEGLATQTAVVAGGDEVTLDPAPPADDLAVPDTPAEEGEPLPIAELPVPTPETPVEPEQIIVAPEYEVPSTYTLRAGEFPYCIARRFDIAPDALLNASGLSSASMVYPGTTLTIPKDAGPFNAGPRSLSTHPVEYTVKANDTVYSIACLFGDVDPRAIEAVNGLTGAYTLNVGQGIQIP